MVPNQAREKWIRKRTSVKIKNGAANHRGSDVIVLEGKEQILQVFSTDRISKPPCFSFLEFRC